MAFSGFDELNRFRCRCNTNGVVDLTVGKDIVVLTGARTVRPEFLNFGQCVTFLQSTSHQSCHRSAVPLAFATASHFAERNLFSIHSADAADKSCIANVGKWNLSLSFHDESC